MKSPYFALLLGALCIAVAQSRQKPSSLSPSSDSLHSVQSAATTTAIVGATLVNVRNGKKVENSIVLFRGERIVDVGVAAKLQTPSDARVVDARGKWLIPGLIDMHVHLWSSDDSQLLPLGLFMAGGITTIRETGDSVLIMRLTKDELSSGKRIGPHFF